MQQVHNLPLGAWQFSLVYFISFECILYCLSISEFARYMWKILQSSRYAFDVLGPVFHPEKFIFALRID
jgi:hypothetical protein